MGDRDLEGGGYPDIQEGSPRSSQACLAGDIVEPTGIHSLIHVPHTQLTVHGWMSKIHWKKKNKNRMAPFSKVYLSCDRLRPGKMSKITVVNSEWCQQG